MIILRSEAADINKNSKRSFCELEFWNIKVLTVCWRTWISNPKRKSKTWRSKINLNFGGKVFKESHIIPPTAWKVARARWGWMIRYERRNSIDNICSLIFLMLVFLTFPQTATCALCFWFEDTSFSQVNFSVCWHSYFIRNFAYRLRGTRNRHNWKWIKGIGKSKKWITAIPTRRGWERT